MSSIGGIGGLDKLPTKRRKGKVKGKIAPPKKTVVKPPKGKITKRKGY